MLYLVVQTRDYLSKLDPFCLTTNNVTALKEIWSIDEASGLLRKEMPLPDSSRLMPVPQVIVLLYLIVDYKFGQQVPRVGPGL